MEEFCTVSKRFTYVNVRLRLEEEELTKVRGTERR